MNRAANRASARRSNRKRRKVVAHWIRATFYPPATTTRPVEYRLACRTVLVYGAQTPPVGAKIPAAVTCSGCQAALALKPAYAR